MIKQQLKTNALLRPDSDCLSLPLRHAPSARAAVAALRTLRWRPSEERDPPITELNQQRASMKSPASDAVPTRGDCLELVLEPVLVAVQPRAA